MQPWMLERGHADVDVDETGVRAEAPMSRRLDDRAEWWKDMQTTRQTEQEQRSKQTTHVDWDPPSVHRSKQTTHVDWDPPSVHWLCSCKKKVTKKVRCARHFTGTLQAQAPYRHVPGVLGTLLTPDEMPTELRPNRATS